MSNWISVKDKLPDVLYQWYLISNNGMATMAFFEKAGDRVDWLCHNDSNNSVWEDVTHWAYLPEAPKE